MNILFLAPQPFFTLRGTPLAVRELISAFLGFGHKVTLLTFHLGDDISLSNLQIARGRVFKSVIKSVPPGFSLKKIILDLELFFKTIVLLLKNKYDLIHCVEESVFFVALIARFTGHRFVYDMDSIIPEQLEESGKIKNRFWIRIAAGMERYAVKRASAVVTVCPRLTDRVRSLFPEKPVFQIEDVSVTEDHLPRAAKDLSGKDALTILYTGNFERYQGIEILLEGFKLAKRKLDNIRLVIVGGEPEEVRVLREKYRDSGIIFEGKRSFDEMPRFLERADILVSPRIKGKNTPFKIYSYMASGKPILATDILSHTQVLKHADTAFLSPPSAEGIAEGIASLVSDPVLMDRLGEKARTLFESNYTKVRYLEKVERYLGFFEGA